MSRRSNVFGTHRTYENRSQAKWSAAPKFEMPDNGGGSDGSSDSEEPFKPFSVRTSTGSRTRTAARDTSPLQYKVIGSSGRMKYGKVDKDKNITMYESETTPSDVVANSRALTNYAHEMHEWDNDRHKYDLESRRNGYEHEEVTNRDRYGHEENMRRVKAWENPDFGRNVLEMRKAQFDYKLKLAEIEERQRRETAEIFATALANQTRKDRERKDVRFARTKSVFQQLLDDLELSEDKLVGSSFSVDFCRSRSSLYTGYKRTFLFWGVDSVISDPSNPSYLLVYYRNEYEPIRVKAINDGMVGFVHIHMMTNRMMCTVDVTETSGGKQRARRTVDFDGNDIGYDTNDKSSCPTNCRV